MAKNYEAITCKVAIYTKDGEKVLIVEYTNNVGYGLPGGHLESGEEPVTACVRELKEELGLAIPAIDLVLKDAWRHPDGKIILGYASVIPEDAIMNNADTAEIQGIHWITIEDIKNGLTLVGTYQQFIVDNQTRTISKQCRESHRAS